MSGDVQPRKRKEKRKRKDELGFDEHRGTSAALGEGDVFIHSQHEHGTGGHWCAKIIFFSLLAVLITLVGLIILENRGLSELEANTVESRYSGVLEGWLEDAPDDDHHDKHTLELKQNSIKSEDVKKHEDDQKVNDSDQSEETEPEESDIDKEDNLSKEDDHDLESDENEDAVRLNKYSSNINYNDDNHDGYDDNNNSENDDDDDDEENDQYEDDDDEDDTNFRVKKDNYNLEQGEYSNNDDELGNNVQNFEEQNDDDDDHGGDDDDDGDEDDDNDDRDDYENDAEDDKSIDDSRNDDVKEDENDDIDVYYSYGEQVINRKNIDDSNEKDDDDDDDDDENDNILTKFNQYLVEKSAEQNENDGHEHENDFETQDTNIERIEREVLDDILISAELPTAGVDDVNDSQQASQEIQNKEDDDENDDEFFEEIGDDELPVVEHITAPAGKPFDEVEESSTEQSPGPDSLADEEEYEKRQEELRREEAEASHKDGGNSIEDEWPGEPTDAYWRDELNKAEEELRQGWLD